MNKRIFALIPFVVLVFSGCGMGGDITDEDSPQVTLSILSLEAQPSDQTGIEDTVTLVMHIDPATYDDFSKIQVLWTVTPSAGSVTRVLEQDTILKLSMPGIPGQVFIEGTAKISTSNQDNAWTTLNVLALAKPEIVWTGVADNGVYFRRDGSLAFVMRKRYQNPATLLAFVFTPRDSSRVVASQSAASVSQIDYRLDISGLLGAYRMVGRVEALNDGGQPVTTLDTVDFEVRGGDILVRPSLAR